MHESISDVMFALAALTILYHICKIFANKLGDTGFKINVNQFQELNT